MPTFTIKPIFDPRKAADETILDGIFRLRHQVFRERLGWDVQSHNGRETDCYDTPEAVYGVAVDTSGDVEGCFRLLPTTGPYMLADVFPALLRGRPAPRDSRVLESSRFAVLPKAWRPNHKSDLIALTCRLLLAQLAYCMQYNFKQVVSVTDIRFERILNASGLHCERFGPPVRLGKMAVVAGWLCVTQENLESVSQVLDSIESYSGPNAADRLPAPVTEQLSEIMQ